MAVKERDDIYEKHLERLEAKRDWWEAAADRWEQAEMELQVRVAELELDREQLLFALEWLYEIVITSEGIEIPDGRYAAVTNAADVAHRVRGGS